MEFPITAVMWETAMKRLEELAGLVAALKTKADGLEAKVAELVKAQEATPATAAPRRRFS